MRLIGLRGKKGVGKNFVANQIKAEAESLGWSYGEDCFAGPFKEFAVNVLGLPAAQVYGSDKDKNTPTQYSWEPLAKRLGISKSGPMTVREVLQTLRTELGREIWGLDIWTSALKNRVQKVEVDLCVVTDVRYNNEADLIHSMGGEVWLVDGPQRGDEFAKNDRHSSENEFPSYDKVIVNGLGDDAASIRGKVKEALNGSL